MVRSLEAHAHRVYQSAMDGDPEAAVRLAERIKQSLPNPFTCRMVAKKGWAGLQTSDDVRHAVDILEDRGWVKIVEVPPFPVRWPSLGPGLDSVRPDRHHPHRGKPEMKYLQQFLANASKRGEAPEISVFLPPPPGKTGETSVGGVSPVLPVP